MYCRKLLISTNSLIAVSLVVLLTSSAADASVQTVTGTNITLLSGSNVSVFDANRDGVSVIKYQNNSPGSLGQFDASLGVLIDATGTLTIVAPATLTRGGSPGSAGFSYQWQLGGNSLSHSTSTTNTSLSLTTPTFGSILLSSSAANLNNFVGPGNIGQNVTNTQLSANRSGTNLSGTSGGVSPNPVVATESIAYTYLTHSNASFGSASDINELTLDFGVLAFGTSADMIFSVFNRGELGLTGLALSFISGDNLFNITGGDIAAGGSSSYGVSFAGQKPLALTNYAGTYRLTYTDDLSGLTRYASKTTGTPYNSNYIDLTLLASVAPAAAPEPASVAVWSLLGIVSIGYGWQRKRKGR